MVNKLNLELLCEDCKSLIGSGRYDQPHANLAYVGGKDMPSIMGRADEAYYLCKVCKHKWLHETGSCGMGWVA